QHVTGNTREKHGIHAARVGDEAGTKRADERAKLFEFIHGTQRAIAGAVRQCRDILNASADGPCRSARRTWAFRYRRGRCLLLPRSTQKPRASFPACWSRKADISSPSSPWNEPAPRCRVRNHRNGIRKL